MIPYGINQEVEFKKNFGPILGDINIKEIARINEENFTKKLNPIYQAINLVQKDALTDNKSVIGFAGAPWTLLVYMINKQSPKKKLIDNFYQDSSLIKEIFLILDKFIKIHVKNQIENGAEVIQIFDSWAGLLKPQDLPYFVYNPTSLIVEYIKSLNVPVICFPRGIKDYRTYCEIVRPDAICIDYETNPIEIRKDIKIPVQGGMDPKTLLFDKDDLKKEIKKYLDIFKDHPYIFNLGHGVLPETDPNKMDYLVKMVKDY